jgi:hypothetical protein
MQTLSKYIPYIVIVILLLLFYRSCEKQEELATAYSAANSEIITAKNKLGQETAQKELIQTENKKAFLNMEAQSKEIAELQKVVKKLRGKNVAATILTNATKRDIVIKTKTILLKDTVDSVIYPTYKYTKINDWENFEISASKDSLSMDYKIYNKFIITQSMEKTGGMFSKRVPSIVVKNENPYTVTKDLQSFRIDCKCKKPMWFGIGAGAGFVAATVLLK